MSKVNQFSQLGISDNLITILDSLKFTQATEIQTKAIPSILMGKDLVGISKTGSGKTLAFVLPMIDILSDQPSRHKMPRALIITPTRELASQIFEVCKLIDNRNEIKVSLLIGGINPNIQIKSLEKSSDIVIATPGRLLEFIESQSLLLNGINYLVLDEADRMLDMGFIEDVMKILKFLPNRCQSLLFSATIPKDIEEIINKLMTTPKKVEAVAQHSEKSIKQYFYAVNAKNRNAKLLSLVEEFHSKKIIIFCSRISEVDNIHKLLLKNFSKSNTILSIHGNIEQTARLGVINTFKTEKLGILVCSDLASRGLDIPLVEYVINYSLPYNFDSYVHRIGRTGRAGASGQSHSFVQLNLDKRVVKGIITKYGQESLELINFDENFIDTLKPKRNNNKNVARRNVKNQNKLNQKGSKQLDKQNILKTGKKEKNIPTGVEIKSRYRKHSDYQSVQSTTTRTIDAKDPKLDVNSPKKLRQFTKENMPNFLKIR